MAVKIAIKDKKTIRGIRQRWLFNSLGVVMLILTLAVGTLSVALWGYYYNSMTTGLEAQASNVATHFRFTTRSEYHTAAQSFIDGFEDKNKIEVQFLDSNGTVIYTGQGLAAGTVPGTPDVTEALENRTMKPWKGRDPATGEHVLAVSAPVIYQGTLLVGAIRFVTSLEAVDRQLFVSILLITLIGLGILALVYISNLTFVRSIVEPLASINETARMIADGSYGVQIEKTFDDEIGDLTDTINDMSIKVMQSEKTQSEFLSSVSHELRTPLTAISGWAETIQSGELSDPEDVKKGMDIIVSEAHRLTNMVEELLEFSRMSDGRFTLAVEPLDLKAELEDAVYTYREFFRRDGIELNYTDCEEEMIPISGDPERLRQVFCNVLDNAAKHGGSGRRIDVSLAVEGGEAVIRIRDYGPGIPEEELPFVKNKFYKGSSKARGSGIGLSVCEEIITRHEGTLELGNAQGGGCVVTVHLPVET